MAFSAELFSSVEHLSDPSATINCVRNWRLHHDGCTGTGARCHQQQRDLCAAITCKIHYTKRLLCGFYVNFLYDRAWFAEDLAMYCSLGAPGTKLSKEAGLLVMDACKKKLCLSFVSLAICNIISKDYMSTKAFADYLYCSSCRHVLLS